MKEKEIVRNKKVREFIKKVTDTGKVTYEEINRELGEDFPAENIEHLINLMLEQGIKIVNEEDTEDEDDEEHSICRNRSGGNSSSLCLRFKYRQQGGRAETRRNHRHEAGSGEETGGA